jgi:hypothetical protein
MAVTIPFIARLKVDIGRDADEIENHKITRWLMMFASNMPLVLDDFRGGKIHCEGVGFSGSPATVYDQYISRLLEDFEERWVRVAEDALPLQIEANLETTALQAAGLINSYSQRILNRARYVKNKLGGMHGGGGETRLRLLPREVPLPEVRLSACAAHLKHQSATNNKRSPLRNFVEENKGPIAAVIAILGLTVAIASLFRG